MKNNFRFKLSAILGDKRMTQKEFSEKTGIRPGTIQKYFHDINPTFKRNHLNKFIEVLGISIHDLFEDNSHPRGGDSE